MIQLNIIEQKILSIVHGLPMEKQHEILNFSLFLKGRSDKQDEISEENPTGFISAFNEFLKEVESDPIDIDISVFDRDRPKESGREIEL